MCISLVRMLGILLCIQMLVFSNNKETNIWKVNFNWWGMLLLFVVVQQNL